MYSAADVPLEITWSRETLEARQCIEIPLHAKHPPPKAFPLSKNTVNNNIEASYPHGLDTQTLEPNPWNSLTPAETMSGMFIQLCKSFDSLYGKLPDGVESSAASLFGWIGCERFGR